MSGERLLAPLRGGGGIGGVGFGAGGAGWGEKGLMGSIFPSGGFVGQDLLGDLVGGLVAGRKAVRPFRDRGGGVTISVGRSGLLGGGIGDTGSPNLSGDGNLGGSMLPRRIINWLSGVMGLIRVSPLYLSPGGPGGGEGVTSILDLTPSNGAGELKAESRGSRYSERFAADF